MHHSKIDKRLGQALRRGICVAAFAAGLGCVAAEGSGYDQRPEVGEYMDGLVAEHGFERGWLARTFAAARQDEGVLARISKPAEKALAWHEYRRIFITDKRIDGGVEFWARHRATLDAASERFAVAPQIVVAIIGVETYYGRVMGDFRVLDSLATLAFDYPRRAKFFKGQLTEFFLLVREEGADPLAFTGSYAGAMGYGQFIPSSYRAFAVDFDGDGQRDIWRNETDAIGSVANYFARHDWQGDGPVALQVQVAKEETKALANDGLELKRTVGEWREAGVAGADAIAPAQKAALYRMETEQGDEFWLALHDFYVITRYNRSAMYALAVLQLSEAIRQRFASQAEGASPDER